MASTDLNNLNSFGEKMEMTNRMQEIETLTAFYSSI